MIVIDPTGLELKIKNEDGKPLVFDPVRKSWLVLTPEEHVRQIVLLHLTERMQYPRALIAVEKKITVGKMAKRFDVVVYDRNHEPWMLVECKEPAVAVSQQTLFQLLNYHRAVPCRYWLLTNGHQTFCANARNPQQIQWMSELPAYDL